MQNTEKQTLMLFSIGPVQEFIAQARKTRDLWFGSYLLSELGKEAAIQLGKYDAKLIFPYLNVQNLEAAQKEEFSAPNQVMAIIDEGDPNAVAISVKQAVEQKWLTYANKAKSELGRSINPALWNRQINDLIEFYAVWTTFDGEDNYPIARQEVGELMTARKTLRNFKQNKPSHMFGEIKSSLDPGRESVLEKHQYEKYAHFGIQQNESLDAISVVKRLIPKDKLHFPSVCDVAFRPLRKKIEQDEKLLEAAQKYLKEVLSTYRQLALREEKQLDARFFYATHVKEMVEEKYIQKDEQERAVEQITKRLDRFYQETNLQPSPYYAFLLCDGDKMGKVLQNMTTIDQHQAFSEKLSQFATSVRSIIKNEKDPHADGGELVYAGGDDVMAYLPLDRCLDVIEQIRNKFNTFMSEGVESRPIPTLSAGVAIVHMMEPLGEVRKLAAQAEKQAKKRRNELSIHFQKRGGGDGLRFSVSFDINPIELIKKLQFHFQDNVFSTRLVYALRSLVEDYYQLQENDKEVLISTDLILLELNYVLKKKKPEGVEDEQLFPLLEIFKTVMAMESGTPLYRLEQLVQLTMIAVYLEKAGDVKR